jgi:antitoxin ParD1/3/4
MGRCPSAPLAHSPRSICAKMKRGQWSGRGRALPGRAGPCYHRLVTSEDPVMGKNTSVALGDHFMRFLEEQVGSGRYGSASEVVRAGLRLLEEREAKLAELCALIAEGEASGPPVPFEPEKWLAEWNADWDAEQKLNEDRSAARRA